MNEREREIIEVSLDDIIPNRFQPRLSFDEQGLNELAESIRQHGIIQPLVLRKIGDKYEIIAGERRYKASYIAGLTKVPAVIIDLNDCKIDSVCDEILYLVEPSSIMLNKLIKKNRNVFEKLTDNKILLNKSLLSNKEVTELEYEANAKMFYNIPPLDERKRNAVLQELLFRLGLVDNTGAKKEEGNKIFGIFSRK